MLVLLPIHLNILQIYTLVRTYSSAPIVASTAILTLRTPPLRFGWPTRSCLTCVGQLGMIMMERISEYYANLLDLLIYYLVRASYHFLGTDALTFPNRFRLRTTVLSRPTTTALPFPRWQMWSVIPRTPSSPHWISKEGSSGPEMRAPRGRPCPAFSSSRSTSHPRRLAIRFPNQVIPFLCDASSRLCLLVASCAIAP